MRPEHLIAGLDSQQNFPHATGQTVDQHETPCNSVRKSPDWPAAASTANFLSISTCMCRRYVAFLLLSGCRRPQPSIVACSSRTLQC
jgi:hypothetical protein